MLGPLAAFYTGDHSPLPGTLPWASVTGLSSVFLLAPRPAVFFHLPVGVPHSPGLDYVHSSPFPSGKPTYACGFSCHGSSVHGSDPNSALSFRPIVSLPPWQLLLPISDTLNSLRKNTPPRQSWSSSTVPCICEWHHHSSYSFICPSLFSSPTLLKLSLSCQFYLFTISYICSHLCVCPSSCHLSSYHLSLWPLQQLPTILPHAFKLPAPIDCGQSECSKHTSSSGGSHCSLMKDTPFSWPTGPAWCCPRLPQLFELQYRSLLNSAKGICTRCSLCLECCSFLLLGLISSWLSCGPQLNHFFLRKAFH